VLLRCRPDRLVRDNPATNCRVAGTPIAPASDLAIRTRTQSCRGRRRRSTGSTSSYISSTTSLLYNSSAQGGRESAARAAMQSSAGAANLDMSIAIPDRLPRELHEPSLTVSRPSSTIRAASGERRSSCRGRSSSADDHRGSAFGTITFERARQTDHTDGLRRHADNGCRNGSQEWARHLLLHRRSLAQRVGDRRRRTRNDCRTVQRNVPPMPDGDHEPPTRTTNGAAFSGTSALIWYEPRPTDEPRGQTAFQCRATV
jgi:hypothetical protein